MMGKKNEATLLEQSDPVGKSSTCILPQFEAAVKGNDLRVILGLVGLSQKGAVKLLRTRYPSMDKATIARCEKAEAYGCVLHPDGYKLLRKRLPEVDTPEAPEAGEPEETARPKRRDGHKLICRISCRLPDDKWLRLRRAIQADGYGTMQEWMSAQVDEYLGRKEKASEGSF